MSEKRKRHFPKPKTFEEWDQIQDEIRRGVDALYERAKAPPRKCHTCTGSGVGWGRPLCRSCRGIGAYDIENGKLEQLLVACDAVIEASEDGLTDEIKRMETALQAVRPPLKDL